MSIFCSFFSFGSEHHPKCKRIKRLGPKCFEQDDSKSCTCGNCPIRYQGSHIFPRNTDERRGNFGISAIPSHITRNGRDNGTEDKWHPWLRVHLYDSHQDSILLTRNQVEKLRDELNYWLDHVVDVRPKAGAAK